jgi:hypothetical protein|tara:strand:+ start:559 stop:828 length:270 start_codon:yes stop_codon:yes gene_type:complete
MMMARDPLDAKGLIREAYRIEGISAPECRSIFLDWALSYADDPKDGIVALLARYADEPADHPMTQTLKAGLEASDPPKRRGGRRARVPY